MKSIYKPISLIPLLANLVGIALGAPSLSLSLGTNPAGPVQFAAQEIEREATAKGIGILKLDESPQSDTTLVSLDLADAPGAQGYSIQVKNEGGTRQIQVRGGDPTGLMYGGLEIAEAIRTKTLETLVDSVNKPHIAKRGIKLNVPLDLRTPSYSCPGDAAQANIPEVWSMDFWRETFDDMARHRYNVVSLWSLNPFPSMVKVPEFPNVALDDVWRTKEKLDPKFSPRGIDFIRPSMLANYEVVKQMTIDQKIQFWRDVMQLAKDRGINVYLFVWNIFLYGAEGKDGITSDKMAPRTIEYFRASVRETILTYPLLAGMGITAGEGFAHGMKSEEKETWLWKTYGEGIRDALKIQPKRDFELIHRVHETKVGEVKEAFADIPCKFEVSYKYSVAHMYSIPNPPFIKEILPDLSPSLRSWLTVRNDDIYSFRWADVDYARAYIKGIPGPDKIAGFYMGPDGYFWGRDFLTKDSPTPRPTVMQKQWLSFALWGRLAYDPELPASVFDRLTAARFPGADVPKLKEAWEHASRTFPDITRFFWGGIDLAWFPEACRRFSGFFTVADFVEGKSMPGAGVLRIIDWRDGLLAKEKPKGITPLEIATILEKNATTALSALPALRAAKVTPATRAAEYHATLTDIESMSHLGLYYSAKIRGACDLAIYDVTKDTANQASAVKHLQTAVQHWKNYSDSYTRLYVQPSLYNRTGWVDLPKELVKVKKDVEIAENWKPGEAAESKKSLSSKGESDSKRKSKDSD
jgi:hypothetical protein